MPSPHANIRAELARISHKTTRTEAERVADMLEAAGIEISGDWGDWYNADDVIEKIDGPDICTEGLFFEWGYSEAARNFTHGEDGVCQYTGEYLKTAEMEGADHYRAVYRGLTRMLEVVQWRDMPSVPSDDIQAMKGGAQ
jgi:hypothetical protein